jgi:hypothetical protein
MAGSQFVTPPRVKPSVPQKRFTLSEANKSLPYVKRVVQDVVTTHQSAVKLQQRIEKMCDKPNMAKQLNAAERELSASQDRFADLMNELFTVGAELKDPSIGLIDFVGRHKGRDVCLCWRLGEERVGFFHELDAGYAGRQPVSSLRESE